MFIAFLNVLMVVQLIFKFPHKKLLGIFVVNEIQLLKQLLIFICPAKNKLKKSDGILFKLTQL